MTYVTAPAMWNSYTDQTISSPGMTTLVLVNGACSDLSKGYVTHTAKGHAFDTKCMTRITRLVAIYTTSWVCPVLTMPHLILRMIAPH